MRFVLRAVNSLMAIPSKPPPLPPTPSTPEGEKSGWVIIYRPADCATRSHDYRACPPPKAHAGGMQGTRSQGKRTPCMPPALRGHR